MTSAINVTMRGAAFLLAAFIGSFVSGCGGGGGGGDGGSPAAPARTLSGTAAAGAPLAGSVTVKDALGATRSVTIGTNGSYSVDVTGMTAPFLFRAEGTVGGRSYVVHSAATEADINGNINITPLTDLVIANVAGQIAASYFDSGNFANLTATALNAQETQLQQRLQTVLTAIGVDSAIDLLRTSFTPNHTSLDAALDILRVTTDVNTGIATITNLITSEQITDDVASTSDVTALAVTTNVATGVTDLQAITATMTQFSNLFATGLPTSAAVQALLHASFLHQDGDGATFAADISSDPGAVGISFTDIAIEQLDPVAGTATISFNIRQNGVITESPETGFWMKKDGTNAWRLAGDQRAMGIYFHAHTVNSFYNSFIAQPGTGVELWVENPNVGNDGGTIAKIVLTGPGLGAGITYVPQGMPSDPYVISSSTVCSMTNTPWCVMASDTNINAIPDNAQYTATTYDAGNAVLNTYTLTLPKRPYTNAELASVSFPVITAPDPTAFLAYSGGAMTVSATLPASATSAWGYLGYTDQNGSGFLEEFKTGLSGSVSYNFTFPALTNVTRLDMRVSYRDIYQREVMTAATKQL